MSKSTPSLPAKADRRQLALSAAIGLASGIVIGCLLAFARELTDSRRQHAASVREEFDELLAEFVSDVRRRLPIARRRKVGGP